MDRSPPPSNFEPTPLPRDPFVFVRVVAALAQAATVLLTWELWQARRDPPTLPMTSLLAMDIDFGPAMLLSLAAALVRPRWGVPAHTVVAAVSMLADQTRIQPQVVSHAILLWGTLGPVSLAHLARTHLVALWFYAGFWKLTSPGFVDGNALWILSRLAPGATPIEARWFATAIFATELSVAALVVFVRTRKAGAWLAYAMHVGILALLSPLVCNVNSSVWPWNVSLAVAALAYFAGWTESPRAAFARLPRWAMGSVAFLAVAPLSHAFGLCDAYLAHSLYANHVPLAVIESRDGTQRVPEAETTGRLNAPLPPERRLYRAYFTRVARPGDRLTIRDPRWWWRVRGREIEVTEAPLGSTTTAPGGTRR